MRARIWFALLLSQIFLFLPNLSWGGVFELSATANYKKTNFDATHSEAQESGTASLGYYFWELSALEFSFTRGAADQIQPEYTAYQDVTAYGVDVLITMANRENALKPYIKVGAAYLVKNLRYYFPTGVPSILIVTQGVAPTAGLGFKLMLTQQFAVKAGVDASSSPLNSTDPTTYDFSAYGGISFLF